MIAFGTVVYNNAIPYFTEFIESIKKQSYKDFTLRIINDDVLIDDLQNKLNDLKVDNYIIISNADGKSPVELRVKLLEEAKKNNFDLLIIGDCDDKFALNRVEKIVSSYEKNLNLTFFYNDLLQFNKQRVMEDLPYTTTCINNILESNYLGLSNTAINLKTISIQFIESLIECNSFVFDWYLFSRILLNGGQGIFVPDTYTLYRIYENNYAGLNNVTEEQIYKEYDVKKKHFTLLSQYDDVFKILLKRYQVFNLEQYKQYSNNTGFWWSNIKLL